MKLPIRIRLTLVYCSVFFIDRGIGSRNLCGGAGSGALHR